MPTRRRSPPPPASPVTSPAALPAATADAQPAVAAVVLPAVADAARPAVAGAAPPVLAEAPSAAAQAQAAWSAGPATPAEPQPRYRIGAVARMLRMPVATLRVWERRYRVTQPDTSASGHRLYSAAEVQRLALLRQLVSLGHAVGALAHLDMAGLHAVAATHARAVAQPVPVPAVPGVPGVPAGGVDPPSPPARPPQGEGAPPDARPGVLLLGEALVQGLGRPAWLRWLAPRCQVLARWPGLDAALAQDSPAQGAGVLSPSVLLASVPSLHLAQVRALAALKQRWGCPTALVLYRYAGPGARAALQQAGLASQVQPVDDAGWQQLVQGWLSQALPASPSAWPATHQDLNRSPGPQGADPLAGDSLPAVPPRRYSDATLSDLAALSSTIVCECPAHVAELLMALSHFEAYSAECAHRSPTDAAMHQHLQRVAGTARALFERALARLAVHEGLILQEAG